VAIALNNFNDLSSQIASNISATDTNSIRTYYLWKVVIDSL